MACVAQAHRCPRHQLPVRLTLIVTPDSRLGGGAKEQVGTERDTLLSPGHQQGWSPLSHSAETCALPPRKAMLQCFPQPPTQLQHRVIMVKGRREMH